jgi:peptidoglycan/xylan/chitin deacetylase (PgdA/CDA1 family)
VTARTRDSARRLYFQATVWSGALRRLRTRLVRDGSLVVLNLHRVSPDPSPFWPPLPPRLFEELLAFLTREARVVTFSDLDSIDARSDLPLVLLSFDDGYKDFVEYAMPILERFGVRVNQNVVPGASLSGQAPWTVELCDFLAAAPPEVLSTIRLPGVALPAVDADGEVSQTRFGSALTGHLKSLPRPERLARWQELEPLFQDVDVKPTRMMTVADIREAAKTHEIGVHSYTHESMALEDDDFFLADFDRCQEFFGSELGRPLQIYAFPNGSYRPGQITLLQERGVQHVLLVDERSSQPTARVHPRFTFAAFTPAELRLRAFGWTRSG